MWDMAFSDLFVRQAIEDLVTEAPNTPITCEMILERIQVPICDKTVRRALKRLEAAQKIVRHGTGYGVGYRYELVS